MGTVSAGFYVNSDNIGLHMSLDETCQSNGEVWTSLTNKDGRGRKGTLAAALPDTNSNDIIYNLIGAMERSVRRGVREVTCDLSPSMMRHSGGGVPQRKSRKRQVSRAAGLQ